MYDDDESICEQEELKETKGVHTFGWAIKHLRDGHCVRLPCWKEGQTLTLDQGVDPETLILSTPGGPVPWESDIFELTREDWEVVRPES